MDKTQFNEALVSLIEYASANANHVSKKDIELHFKEILTDESMYNAIYSYLKESKISIDDVADSEIPSLGNTAPDISDSELSGSNLSDSSPSDPAFSISDNKASDSSILGSFSPANVVESDQELAVLEMYKNDMNNIAQLSDEEKTELIELLLAGDSLAMAKLTEGYLYMVHETATHFRGKGLTLGDLIQEGNIGLMLALSEYSNTSSEGVVDVPAFEAFLESKIKESLDDAINIQISSERIGSHLADRMNSLDTLSRDLTEKLGHAPSVKELAEEMNISEDEVDTIIRTSLNVLSVEQAEEE